MLYYAILYYTILYYTIIYYTILYYTILYYTILYYTILYYTILCYKRYFMDWVYVLPGGYENGWQLILAGALDLIYCLEKYLIDPLAAYDFQCRYDFDLIWVFIVPAWDWLMLSQSYDQHLDCGICSLNGFAFLLYIILYYTILYYTILYYTILYYTLLYSTILSTLLYYTILYYTILYYTILY
jgi:hypothetical protein